MKNSIIEIKDEKILQDKYQSVFVTFLARQKKKIKSVVKEIPIFLIIWRDDGRFGFPGGRYAEKDSYKPGIITINDLKRTAIREVKEEIGYKIPSLDNLKLSSSMLYKNNQITNFVYFLTEKEMLNIFSNYYKNINNIQCREECFGLNMVYIHNEYVLKEIMKHNFKATCKMEINKILETHFCTQNSSIF